jgi:hypothetical protein
MQDTIQKITKAKRAGGMVQEVESTCLTSVRSWVPMTVWQKSKQNQKKKKKTKQRLS